MLASTAFFLGLLLGGFILVVVLIYNKKTTKECPLSVKKLENGRKRKRKKKLLKKSGKTNKQVTKINFKFLNQL